MKSLKRIKQARKPCGLHGPLWAAVGVVLSEVQNSPLIFGQDWSSARDFQAKPCSQRLVPYSCIVLYAMWGLYTFSDKKPSGS